MKRVERNKAKNIQQASHAIRCQGVDDIASHNSQKNVDNSVGECWGSRISYSKNGHLGEVDGLVDFSQRRGCLVDTPLDHTEVTLNRVRVIN